MKIVSWGRQCLDPPAHLPPVADFPAFQRRGEVSQQGHLPAASEGSAPATGPRVGDRQGVSDGDGAVVEYQDHGRRLCRFANLVVTGRNRRAEVEQTVLPGARLDRHQVIVVISSPSRHHQDLLDVHHRFLTASLPRFRAVFCRSYDLMRITV